MLALDSSKPIRFVLVESSLETIPRKLYKHPAVRKTARRRNKPVSAIILDRSLHHSAMKGLAFAEKRGRPDIVHFTLLEVLGSPLNKAGYIEVFVHTIQDVVIRVDSSTRLPKNYNRFIGLMEQLFSERQVPPDSSNPLIQIVEEKLQTLVSKHYSILLWEKGDPITAKELGKFVADKIKSREKVAILIGGFPHGDFSSKILELANKRVRIGSCTSYEAWIVASRVLASIEIELGLI